MLFELTFHLKKNSFAMSTAFLPFCACPPIINYLINMPCEYRQQATSVRNLTLEMVLLLGSTFRTLLLLLTLPFIFNNF